MKDEYILPYLGHICDRGNFFLKQVILDPFPKTLNLQKLDQLLLSFTRKMQNT
jgi:hypothetical protein